MFPTTIFVFSDSENLLAVSFGSQSKLWGRGYRMTESSLVGGGGGGVAQTAV